MGMIGWSPFAKRNQPTGDFERCRGNQSCLHSGLAQLVSALVNEIAVFIALDCRGPKVVRKSISLVRQSFHYCMLHVSI